MEAIPQSHFEIKNFFQRSKPVTPVCNCRDRRPGWFVIWQDAAGLVGIYMRKELTRQGIATRVTPHGKLLGFGRCSKLQRIAGQWLSSVKTANEL